MVRLADAENEIRDIGIDASGRFIPPAGGERVDLTDLMALPGLVDSHAHLTAADVGDMVGPADEAMRTRLRTHSALQLAGGVTLVVDKGTHDVRSVDMLLGIPVDDRPEIEAAGRFLTTAGGYYSGIADEIAAEDLGAVVAALPVDRTTWVKVVGDWPRREIGAVPNFEEHQLAAATLAAHAGGRRIAIHAAAPDTPHRAVRAGIDSVEHGLFMTEDDLAMLGARGGAWVPTVAAMRHVADYLGHDSSGGALLLEGLANVRRLLPHAVEAGVRVLGGTDLALSHGAVATEAVHLHDHGLSATDAIAAVTTTPRRYLGQGGIEPGWPADLVLVDRDGGVAGLTQPRMVVRRGRVIVGQRP